MKITFLLQFGAGDGILGLLITIRWLSKHASQGVEKSQNEALNWGINFSPKMMNLQKLRHPFFAFALGEQSPTAAQMKSQHGYVTFWREARVILHRSGTEAVPLLVCASTMPSDGTRGGVVFVIFSPCTVVLMGARSWHGLRRANQQPLPACR